MESLQISLRVTSFVLLLALSVSAETYYVTPSSSSQCQPGEDGVPCFTLSQYAAKPNNYFASNTTLILLPGNHNLDLELSIRNISFLSVESNAMSQTDTTIICYQSAKLTFDAINVVSVRGLVLFGCMNNKVTMVDQFTMEDSTFNGQGRYGTGLELNEVSDTNFTRSTFSSNTGRETYDVNGTIYRRGGAVIAFGVNSFLISDTIFHNNSVTVIGGTINKWREQQGGAVYANACNIMIVNSTFSNNTVTGDNVFGGAVYAHTSPITILDSRFNGNSVTGDYGAGGALCVESSPNITIVNSVLDSNTVNGSLFLITAQFFVLVNSTLSRTLNSSIMYVTSGDGDAAGGAVYVDSSPISIVNSTLNNNIVSGQYRHGDGGAMYAEDSPSITVIDSKLNNNTATKEGGALYIESSHITVLNSTLNYNTVTGDDGAGGAVFVHSSPTITIVSSELHENAVNGTGGAIQFDLCPNITIADSAFNSNTATGSTIGTSQGGGAVYIDSCSIAIVSSTFTENAVTGKDEAGGAVYVYSSNITIFDSVLNDNTAAGDGGWGGAVYSYLSSIAVLKSTLNNNRVNGGGGAVFVYSSDINLTNSKLNGNIVTGDGGAVYAYSTLVAIPYTVSVANNTFSFNSCTDKGSVFYLKSVTFNSSGFLDIHNNMASTGVLYAVESTLYLSGNTTMTNNYGSLFLYSSSASCVGVTNIINNSFLSNTSQEGGAVTSIQSEIVFMGRTNFMYNRAVKGGAISATQSKLYMYGEVTVSHNTASVSGGGVYAYQSELNLKDNIIISSNTAINSGGGIHAISSTTRLTDGSKVYIASNHAKRGGGICLETGAKIYLDKRRSECASRRNCKLTNWIEFSLHNNTAKHGGAVFVDDETNSATCYATPSSDEEKSTISSECFIQSLGLYEVEFFYSQKLSQIIINVLNTYFMDNSASDSGDVLYGGLLDRCKVSPLAEVYQKYTDSIQSSLTAISYIANITNLEREDFNSTQMISSDPVRVCFCRDNQPDCSYHPHPVTVSKGETFTVSLVAVDHINNTISNSTIHAYVSLEGALGEGQSSQLTIENGECTDLTYSILSPKKSEVLYLYADGPCMNTGISVASLTVNIAPCPIGFKDKNLRCDCDPILLPEYISNCSIDSETVQRKDNVWFAHVNTTNHQGFVLHKYCPFDFCRPATENISVNLNIENGANELCNFNRSGKLCGSCDDGLSLSLGTSRCRPCSNNWLSLLIVFAIAGVVLVAFLLKLNLTVAEGTLNGLIFYANIFAANRTTFFPNDETKILTVFIAWLNLDFGFETCFYDGMDGYAKTWLQLAFPLYVIFLVAAIIIISDYSTKFAKLFTGKNPIATLATLILLSYTKLLRTIIASLSFTRLQYSDSSYELVWLIDANIPYLSGKHIPLFITALVIVVVGTVYTIVLFAWQWLVYCPNRGPLRWIIGNTKVISLMDAYHNPYNKEHRYWIGLLLLVRVLLYLVYSANVFGDPHINLLTTASVIVVLLSFQNFVEYKHKNPVHKTWLSYAPETISILNVAGLTIVTYFMTNEKASQYMVAYASTGVALVTFLAILCYHVYQSFLHGLFEKLLMKVKLKIQTMEPQNKLPTSAQVSIPVEEPPVSESEVNALPVAMDTISISSEEQEEFVTADSETVDTVKLAKQCSCNNTVSSFSGFSPRYLEDSLITMPAVTICDCHSEQSLSVLKAVSEDETNYLSFRKNSNSSLTSKDLLFCCHDNTPSCEETKKIPFEFSEIELHNLASEQELNSPVQSAVLISLGDDADNESVFEDDESTPLLLAQEN